MIKLECTNLTRVVDWQLRLMIRQRKNRRTTGQSNKSKSRPNKYTHQQDSEKLCNLRKENKFINKTYFELYPSDPILTRLYGTIKAHKPEKTFPCESLYLH